MAGHSAASVDGGDMLCVKIEHFGATLSELNHSPSRIVGEGPMNNRSATALLSPVELTALCRIADGRTRDLKPDHLQLLLAMGLAALDKNDRRP